MSGARTISECPQPVRRHEEAAGPRAGDRVSVRPGDHVIGVVVDHEERSRAAARQRHDIEVRPGEPDALLAVRAEPVDHIGTEAELPRPEQRVADGVGGWRDEHRAGHCESRLQRQGRHRRAERVRDDSVCGTVRLHDRAQRPSHLRHRAHPAAGSAVPDGVERDGPETGIDQRLDVRREPAAARSPAVHQVDRGPFTPRPPDDTLAFDLDLEWLSLVQDGVHRGRQPGAVRRKEHALRDSRRRSGRDPLQATEEQAEETHIR
jgi:hypothetical protein